MIRVAGNKLLTRLAENHWASGKMVTGKKSDPQRVFGEHRAILKAIESGDERKAEQTAREHIRVARRIVTEKIQDGTFEPRWVVREPGRSVTSDQ